MSFVVILECDNGKFFIGNTNNAIGFFNNCLKSKNPYFTNNKPKNIVFVDQCDFATKYGQLMLKHGENNVKHENMEGFKILTKNPKKGLENYGKKWTQEEKVQVLSDYKNKIPVKDIANKYKRTIGAVVAEIHSNIPKTTDTYPEPTKKGEKWTTEENDNVILLYNTNVDMKQIVEKLGRSKRAIECHLIQLGVYKFN